MVRCRLAPLQSNIFSNDQDIQVLSVGIHNHNSASYTKSHLKEIIYRNEAAQEFSEHENRVNEINDDHIEHDFMHKKIGSKPDDCIYSARNRSSFDTETVQICYTTR